MHVRRSSTIGTLLRRALVGWRRRVAALLVAFALLPVGELAEGAELAAQSRPVIALSVESGCASDCAEACRKAGCHGAVHHCGCCAPTPRLAATAALPVLGSTAGVIDPPEQDRVPPTIGEAPPLPPPRG